MLIYVSHRASLHQPCMKLHRTYLYAAFYLLQGEKCSFSNVKSVLINSCQRRNAAFGNGQIVIACDAYILRNTIAVTFSFAISSTILLMPLPEKCPYLMMLSETGIPKAVRLSHIQTDCSCRNVFRKPARQRFSCTSYSRG